MMIALRSGSFTELILWGTILLLLLVVAFMVVRKLRDSNVRNDQHPLEMLSNFQEMRVQGDINDSEFRTIQSLLNTSIPKEANEAQKES
jgi:uncharacterized membrane protein